MKYKVGDRVRIKSLDWYNKNINNNSVIICGSESFTKPMSRFCNKVVTIVTIQDGCYKIFEDNGDWYWSDEMIEGLAEEETLIKLTGKTIKNDEMVVSINEYTLPDGYIFKDENGNVINATKIVLEKKKKKEYPKTYEECVRVLEGENRMSLEQMNTFRKLIDARNAYWKIAGEEMGLGKPWSPSDSDYITGRYCIFVHRGNIICDTPAQDCILTFPTEEMRDAFKENFDPDIEICKELL